ncbi:hypothetical protein [Leucobacter sp. G161]|uniref:hypothetical protein n=1 Tax=Leucobacter sp. G161 TaxID=663704 RepID=UPI00073B54E3|nr:hypothetical protein [Leucobacter sp. G161]KUF05548.1 hypothetical protein AUL38_04120 [Leucobacter sp. G161]
MSDTFTASTGRTVAVKSRSMMGTALEISGLGTRTTVDRGDGATLREFFLHERDKELGRWRWPENRAFVVYPQPDGTVTVLDEVIGDGLFTCYGRATDEQTTEGAAALAYFAAHPEPRPWHDAKPGEVWVLRVRDEPEGRPYTVGDTGFTGEDIRGEYWGAIPVESNVFTAGRRIWPEVTP